MLPMTDGLRLAIIASQYQAVATRVVSDGSGKQLLLMRDPKRVYVLFRAVGGIAYPMPYPGQIPSGLIGSETHDGDLEFKQRDCPALVTGEWYMVSTVPGDTIDILTESYIGR